jgi:hypothetical protein
MYVHLLLYISHMAAHTTAIAPSTTLLCASTVLFLLLLLLLLLMLYDYVYGAVLLQQAP